MENWRDDVHTIDACCVTPQMVTWVWLISRMIRYIVWKILPYINFLCHANPDPQSGHCIKSTAYDCPNLWHSVEWMLIVGNSIISLRDNSSSVICGIMEEHSAFYLQVQRQKQQVLVWCWYLPTTLYCVALSCGKWSSFCNALWKQT